MSKRRPRRPARASDPSRRSDGSISTSSRADDADDGDDDRARKRHGAQQHDRRRRARKPRAEHHREPPVVDDRRRERDGDHREQEHRHHRDRTPGPTMPRPAQRPIEHDARPAPRPPWPARRPGPGPARSDSPRSSTASTTVAAVRHDDRADHAQRPDPKRGEVAQVRDGGPDAQRQAREDPGGSIGASASSGRRATITASATRLTQLGPGQQAEAADPAARDGARDVHDDPTRRTRAGRAGGRGTSAESTVGGGRLAGCRVLHFPAGPPDLSGDPRGDVAQLGERRVRIAEARGSSPLISTIVGRLGRW